MKPLRIWLIGAGTVGTWLLGVLDSQAQRLASRYGVRLTIIGPGAGPRLAGQGVLSDIIAAAARGPRRA